MAHKHRETSPQQYPHGHLKRKPRDKLDHPGNRDFEDQHSTQISELQRKLRAAEERILNLQLRNRALLDDLDEVRASSAADAERAQKDILFLGRRCVVLQEEAERTLREKEYMNETLRLLVEKVEACNADFSAWKPANLRMSRSLSILPQDNLSTSSESCSCPRAYGSAIVAELSHLLSREREAHRETILVAEQRLAHYEAAIARREADLACVLEACHCDVASVVAASFSELRGTSPDQEGKVERTLAVEVLNLRGEVQAEKSRRTKRRKSTPVSPSHSQNTSPTRRPLPHPTIIPPADPEPDLVALVRQIDSLRAEVLRLSSEKDALQHLVQAEFPSNLPKSPSRSPPRYERELALLQENERLREALAQAQRNPSSSRTQSLPSPAIHASSVLASPDLFRSPLPNQSAIDVSFPPLTPDHSSAASTSLHGYSAYDDVEGMFPVDLSEVIPLPLSPLLSPLPYLVGPSGSQPHSRVQTPLQTPLDMSLCSDESDETIEGEESPTLRAAALLRQQREADLEAQLAVERLGADVREREMLELREAIASLALGAGLGAPDAQPPFEFNDDGSSGPG